MKKFVAYISVFMCVAVHPHATPLPGPGGRPSSGPAHPAQPAPGSSQSDAKVQVTGEACADRWRPDLENLENLFFPPELSSRQMTGIIWSADGGGKQSDQDSHRLHES